MNYEKLTGDQEQQVITDLKDSLRGILLENVFTHDPSRFLKNET